MIHAQMMAVLVNLLTVTCVNQIRQSATAAASRGRERESQNQREADTEVTGPFLNIHFESGWEEQIQKIQKPAFSGVTWTNKNFPITQDSSPLDAFAIFFSTELFTHAKQQIRKKKQVGPLYPKFVFA
jgi:hypothetical protein